MGGSAADTLPLAREKAMKDHGGVRALALVLCSVCTLGCVDDGHDEPRPTRSTEEPVASRELAEPESVEPEEPSDTVTEPPSVPEAEAPVRRDFRAAIRPHDWGVEDYRQITVFGELRGDLPGPGETLEKHVVVDAGTCTMVGVRSSLAARSDPPEIRLSYAHQPIVDDYRRDTLEILGAALPICPKGRSLVTVSLTGGYGRFVISAAAVTGVGDMGEFDGAFGGEPGAYPHAGPSLSGEGIEPTNVRMADSSPSEGEEPEPVFVYVVGRQSEIHCVVDLRNTTGEPGVVHFANHRHHVRLPARLGPAHPVAPDERSRIVYSRPVPERPGSYFCAVHSAEGDEIATLTYDVVREEDVVIAPD